MGGNQQGKSTDEDTEIEAEAKALVEKEMSASTDESTDESTGGEEETVDLRLPGAEESVPSPPGKPETNTAAVDVAVAKKAKRKKTDVETRPAKAEKNAPSVAVAAEAQIMPWHIPETKNEDEGYRVLRQLSEVRVDDPRVIALSPKDPRLVLDRFNVRKEKASYFVERLHNSMVEEGQQKPLIVTPRVTPQGEELLIVAGNTRERAAVFEEKKKEGKKRGKKGEAERRIDKIFVLPVQLTDEQAWFIALQSNLDNSLPMNELDEDEQGAAILRLVDEYHWKQERVAELMHRDQSWVSRQVRLSKVDPQIEEMIKDEELTESHAEAIMTLPKNLQSNIADKVKDEELNVQETQKLVNKLKAIAKAGQGIPEEVLVETVIDGELIGDDWTQEKAVEITRTISEAIGALNQDVREALGIDEYDKIADFVNKILNGKMSLPAAKEFASAVNLAYKDAVDLTDGMRDNIVDEVIEKKKTVQQASDYLKILRVALGSEGIPKPIREILANDILGRSTLNRSSTGRKYNLARVQKLVNVLQEGFQVATQFPQGTQAKFARKIIDRNYGIPTAKKLAETLQTALEGTMELDKSLRGSIIDFIVGHNYGQAATQQLSEAVKKALKKGTDAYKIESELQYKEPNEWKALVLSPEIEAAQKKAEEQERIAAEEEWTAALEEMVKTRELTPDHAEIIKTLPKWIQREITESLTYEGESGGEELLELDATRKMVDKVRTLLDAKASDMTKGKLSTKQLLGSWELRNILDVDQYLQKPKEEPAVESVVPPQGDISEQLFDKHISDEGPASAEDLKTAENLHPITGPRPWTGEPVDVGKGPDGRMVFHCPNCHVALSVTRKAVDGYLEDEKQQ